MNLNALSSSPSLSFVSNAPSFPQGEQISAEHQGAVDGVDLMPSDQLGHGLGSNGNDGTGINKVAPVLIWVGGAAAAWAIGKLLDAAQGAITHALTPKPEKPPAPQPAPANPPADNGGVIITPIPHKA